MKKAINFAKVFAVFRKNYIEVPLEYFKDDPYKTLISTLLSSRTKDEVTLEASKRLFDKAPDLKRLNYLTQIKIRKLIYPVGFYKTKAIHLKNLSKKLLREFEGKIPQTRDELMSLPGVGRKTANLVLNRAFKIPAIAVDTHVHRITNLLGWVRTKTPRETENKLNETLPMKYWPDTNRLFVSIGRQFTSAKKLEGFLNEHELLPKSRFRKL